MRKLVLAAIIIVNLILQSTIFQAIEIFGIKPNTAILIIVSYAILREDFEGSIVGFFVGLLTDLMFGYYIGLHALLGMLTGYLCGKPFRHFYKENYLMPIILTAASVTLYEFIFYVVNFMLKGRTEFDYYLAKVIIPEILYSTALSAFVYRLMLAVNTKLEAYEKKRASFLTKHDETRSI